MPELPEIQAHAERLDAEFAGRVLERFVPLRFTALKTAVPPPDAAYGLPLSGVGRRGKYLLLRFEPLTFVVHLMQGGRLVADTKLSARPRGGQARFLFESAPDAEPTSTATGTSTGTTNGVAAGVDGGTACVPAPALLLTEQGTERRAGVWCVPSADLDTAAPLSGLGPDADQLDAEHLTPILATHSMRLHGLLRDQHIVAGIGRRLANEICHRARVSPFANAARLDPDTAARVAEAIRTAITESLAEERGRATMSSSADRASGVHGRTGDPCPVCGDVVRAVEYSGYTVHYCPSCQTGGKTLADNTTSRFLK